MPWIELDQKVEKIDELLCPKTGCGGIILPIIVPLFVTRGICTKCRTPFEFKEAG